MIVSFRSKALQRFWIKGQTKHVQAAHVAKLTMLLATLDAAASPQGMNVAGWGFHLLTGNQAGRYAVKVDKNWRLTFGWSATGPDAIDTDYEDYH
jgi:toxin HigB-1